MHGRRDRSWTSAVIVGGGGKGRRWWVWQRSIIVYRGPLPHVLTGVNSWWLNPYRRPPKRSLPNTDPKKHKILWGLFSLPLTLIYSTSIFPCYDGWQLHPKSHMDPQQSDKRHKIIYKLVKNSFHKCFCTCVYFSTTSLYKDCLQVLSYTPFFPCLVRYTCATGANLYFLCVSLWVFSLLSFISVTTRGPPILTPIIKRRRSDIKSFERYTCKWRISYICLFILFLIVSYFPDNVSLCDNQPFLCLSRKFRLCSRMFHVVILWWLTSLVL